MNNVLEIFNLTKRFGSLTAVDNLSFQVQKGNVYGLLGPNGSGKSTTLGMLLTSINPTSGDWKWFDNASHEDALKRIGATIERPNFYPYLNATQNLLITAKIKGVPASNIDKNLELVGLLDRKKDKFSTYSLGMKQRLAIASAMLNDPEVLILDEPTNGLDPMGIIQIRDIISSIATKGTTIILASHLLDEVEKVCSHVIVLRNGKSLYSGEVNGMTNSKPYFELSAADMTSLKAALQQIGGMTIGTQHGDVVRVDYEGNMTPEALNRLLFDKGVVLSHLIKKKNSLETQFLELVKK
ncbi:MAG: ATP-binding cassette domain-containing protein [Saprospiraceae bacterium]|nr:ATP-binding cassette domain-containing protein [Saprospiraceae bacterium]